MFFGSGGKPPIGNVDLKISHQLRFSSSSSKKKNLSPLKTNKENISRHRVDRKHLHSHPMGAQKNDLYGESFRPKPTAVENITKHLDFSKKLSPLTSMVGDISFDEGYNNGALEKIVSMMNMDNELYYLASSLSYYLKFVKEEDLDQRRKKISTEESEEPKKKKVGSNTETLLRRESISKSRESEGSRILGLPPLRNLEKGRNLSEKRLPFAADLSEIKRGADSTDRFLDINGENDVEKKTYLRSVPIPFERFKNSLATEINGFSPEFRFFKLSVRTNFRAPMDMGFIEIEVLKERRCAKILKLYIFKIFRQMTLSEELHKKLFDQIYEIEPAVEKLIIRVLGKYDNYKGFLIKCGFTLEKRILLDANEFDILVKRK